MCTESLRSQGRRPGLANAPDTFQACLCSGPLSPMLEKGGLPLPIHAVLLCLKTLQTKEAGRPTSGQQPASPSSLPSQSSDLPLEASPSKRGAERLGGHMRRPNRRNTLPMRRAREAVGWCWSRLVPRACVFLQLCLLLLPSSQSPTTRVHTLVRFRYPSGRCRGMDASLAGSRATHGRPQRTATYDSDEGGPR